MMEHGSKNSLSQNNIAICFKKDPCLQQECIMFNSACYLQRPGVEDVDLLMMDDVEERLRKRPDHSFCRA